MMRAAPCHARAAAGSGSPSPSRPRSADLAAVGGPIGEPVLRPALAPPGTRGVAYPHGDQPRGHLLLLLQGRQDRPSVNRRPFDLALVAFFAVTILYGLLFSLPEGLGVPCSPHSPGPPLRSLYGWAVAQEPAHLDPPPVLIASCLFDGLFQVPALLFVVYGLLRETAW